MNGYRIPIMNQFSSDDDRPSINIFVIHLQELLIFHLNSILINLVN